MAYEREAIIPTNSAQPAASQMEMREERVISPYQNTDTRIQQATERLALKQKLGQTNVKASSASPMDQGSGAVEQNPSLNLSPAAAALARKEAKFRQQEQEFKTKEAQRAKDFEELEALRQLKAKLDSKDYSAIEGSIDYNEYTNYLIEKSAGDDPVQDELKKLAQKVDAVEASRKEEISKRFDAAVQERRLAVKALAESNPEFSLIKKAGAEEHVVQHILDTWEHENVDLSVEQAAKEVDAILKEKAKKWAELVELKNQDETSQEDSRTLPPLKPGIKTLTNNMAPTGEINRPKKSFQGMTDTERWAEARRRAEEKLKKGF